MSFVNDMKNVFVSKTEQCASYCYRSHEDCGISYTQKILGASIRKILNEENKSFVRQVAARIVLLSTPLFQLFDGLANLAYPIGKTCLFKVTRNPAFAIDNHQRRCHFKYAAWSFLGAIFLLPVLLYRPSLIGPPPAQKQMQKQELSENIENNAGLPVPPVSQSSLIDDPGVSIDHQAAALKELSEKQPSQLNKDWNLLNYFGHIRIINLDKDKEKLGNIISNLSKVGIHYQEEMRFSAVLGRELDPSLWNRMDNNYKMLLSKDKLDRQHQGQMGCFMSHYRVILEAKSNFERASGKLRAVRQEIELASNPNEASLRKRLEEAEKEVKKYSSVLILEDDNQFGRIDKDKPSLEGVGQVFRECMAQLPKDFDMFYFMALDYNWLTGNHAPIYPNQRIKPLFMGLDLNAYAVHARFYDTILNFLEKKINDPDCLLEPIDAELSKLMPANRVYRSTPPLAFQGGYESGIVQGEGVRPYVQRNSSEWERVVLEKRKNVKKAASIRGMQSQIQLSKGADKAKKIPPEAAGFSYLTNSHPTRLTR